MKDNLVLKASAGTGKTFALATRFIKLMVFRNVRPETVLALTFSRAAAQEIYEKILKRLREAAASDEAARRERDENLLEDLREKSRGGEPLSAEERAELAFVPEGGWTAATFARVLRRLIDAQGHDTIATLDSFILRIVRKFPLETGFAHALSVQDDYGQDRAKVRAQADLLATTSGDADVAREFFAARDGAAVRSGAANLSSVVRSWLGFLSEHPEAETWTADSMRAALGVPARPQAPVVPVFSLGKRETAVVDAIRNWVESFDGAKNPFPDTKAGEVLRFFRSNPGAAVCEFDSGTTRTVHYRFDVGPAGAAALRAAADYLVAAALDKRIGIAAARIALCARIGRLFRERTFGKGLLTFSDFTRSLAACENSDRRLDLRNLQFRLDSEFDHWALDEFQDTSREQWLCLRPLVQEAATGEGRSVLAVGDLKQSIYGWRGGDDGPFLDLMAFVGPAAVEELPVSWRYGWNTARFVDAVFGPDNVRGFAGGSCPAAVAKWTGSACWPKEGHRAADGKTDDFVEIVRVAKTGDDETAGDDGDDPDSKPSAAMKQLAPAVCAFVADLWAAHEAAGSRDTVGILVRTNRDGLYLAEKLREADWPGGRRPDIVWEGESAVLDVPVVRALLELLRLADHPEDAFAWACVDRLFPVRERIFPTLLSAEDVSREVARRLSRQGLSRTLASFAAKLKEADDLDPRSRSRLAKLVREALAFESRPEAAEGTEAFAGYLASVRDRDVAVSPDAVRILTIHRSKGLTLGHVVVPVAENARSDEMTQPKFNGIVSGDGWAFESLPDRLADEHPALLAARNDASDGRFLEVLRTYYVAATRAEKSTHFFVLDDMSDGKRQFRNLLVRPFGSSEPRESPFGTILHSGGTAPSFANPAKASGERRPAGSRAWSAFGPRTSVLHQTPSAAHPERLRTVADLLGENAGAAMARGVDEHAGFAAIEWIDPARPRSDRERAVAARGGAWLDAFRKTPGATVWREFGYELYDPVRRVWETGRFDRVVFRGDGTAAIYDFKTDAKGETETVPGFEARIRAAYAGQMSGYRRALSRLTGIPESSISTTLLLEDGGRSVSRFPAPDPEPGSGNPA